ncbi:hypothetical protein [Nocardia sp. NPDC047654]|uniref:hypothetical protein n=1 Tax=Nocardia sp. NPDC047654 TaxID=3364314 RepID=UPI003712DE2E
MRSRAVVPRGVAGDVAAAVPGVWSGESAAAIVAALVGGGSGAPVREAALALVRAAERGEAGRAALADAYLQLIMAEVAVGE